MKKLEKLKQIQNLKSQTENKILLPDGGGVDYTRFTQPEGTVTTENTGNWLNWDFHAYPDIKYGDSWRSDWWQHA